MHNLIQLQSSWSLCSSSYFKIESQLTRFVRDGFASIYGSVIALVSEIRSWMVLSVRLSNQSATQIQHNSHWLRFESNSMQTTTNHKHNHNIKYQTTALFLNQFSLMFKWWSILWQKHLKNKPTQSIYARSKIFRSTWCTSKRTKTSSHITFIRSTDSMCTAPTHLQTHTNFND